MENYLAQVLVWNAFFHPRETVDALYGHSGGSSYTPPSTPAPRPRGHAVIPSGNCYSPFPDGVENGRPHYALKSCKITVREAQVGHALTAPHHSGTSTRRPHKH